ncbi:MAG: tetratricopeptide repeat protein [Phycisphaerales bacterium]|nr:MAG: tetratricopeptide repeat protein [Phycisphaerales bacterium]
MVKRGLVVFAVALLVRFVYLYEVRTIPFFEFPMVDSRSYDQWGQRIASGDWWGDEVFYQAPAYPYLLGVIYSVAGHNLMLVHVVQIIMGAMSCVLIYLAGRRFFGERAGLAAGVLLALYAPAIFFDGVIHKTGLGLFLTSLLLYLLARTLDRTTTVGFVLCGLASGVLALTRENMLLLIAVVPVWILLRTKDCRIKGRLGWTLGYLAGAALVLVPVGFRNYSVGSVFAVTTFNVGPNFYFGNNPDANGLYEPLRHERQDPLFERQDAIDVAEQALGRELAPGEVSDYWFRRGMAFVTGQPVAWLRLMLRKVLLTWNRFEVPDTEDLYTYAEWSSLLGVLRTVFHFGVLAPLGIAGIVLSWPQWRRAWLLYLLLAFITAGVAIFFVFARYRFPLVPVLVPLAGYACIESLAACRARRVRTLAVAAAFAVVAAFLVNRPMVPESAYRSVAFANLSIACGQAGRMGDAERYLHRAIELYPDNAAAHGRLGMLMARTGRPEAGVKHLRKATALDPTVAATHVDLARVLAGQGRTDQAELHYRQAIRLKPDGKHARMALVELLSAKGSKDEALHELELLTLLDPDNARLRLRMGLLLREVGRDMDADREFRLAVSLDPAMADALEAEGIKLSVGADRLPPETSPETQPKDAETIVQEARQLAQIGRFVAAIEQYESAIELEPDDPFLHYEIGGALSAIDRHREAMEHYKRAIELSPGFAEAHNNLGQIYGLLNDTESAVKHYRLAVAANPQMLQAHYNLATGLAALGRFDEAIAAMERCLELASSADRTDLISRIEDRLARLRQEAQSRSERGSDRP